MSLIFEKILTLQIVYGLLKASHLRFHGWSFFGLGQDLVIYNEMAICVLGNNSRDKTTYGHIYTSEKGAEVVTFSSPVRINKCTGKLPLKINKNK